MLNVPGFVEGQSQATLSMLIGTSSGMDSIGDYLDKHVLPCDKEIDKVIFPAVATALHMRLDTYTREYKGFSLQRHVVRKSYDGTRVVGNHYRSELPVFYGSLYQDAGGPLVGAIMPSRFVKVHYYGLGRSGGVVADAVAWNHRVQQERALRTQVESSRTHQVSAQNAASSVTDEYHTSQLGRVNNEGAVAAAYPSLTQVLERLQNASTQMLSYIWCSDTTLDDTGRGTCQDIQTGQEAPHRTKPRSSSSRSRCGPRSQSASFTKSYQNMHIRKSTDPVTSVVDNHNSSHGPDVVGNRGFGDRHFVSGQPAENPARSVSRGRQVQQPIQTHESSALHSVSFHHFRSRHQSVDSYRTGSDRGVVNFSNPFITYGSGISRGVNPCSSSFLYPSQMAVPLPSYKSGTSVKRHQQSSTKHVQSSRSSNSKGVEIFDSVNNMQKTKVELQSRQSGRRSCNMNHCAIAWFVFLGVWFFMTMSILALHCGGLKYLLQAAGACDALGEAFKRGGFCDGRTASTESEAFGVDGDQAESFLRRERETDGEESLLVPDEFVREEESGGSVQDECSGTEEDDARDKEVISGGESTTDCAKNPAPNDSCNGDGHESSKFLSSADTEKIAAFTVSGQTCCSDAGCCFVCTVKKWCCCFGVVITFGFAKLIDLLVLRNQSSMEPEEECRHRFATKMLWKTDRIPMGLPSIFTEAMDAGTITKDLEHLKAVKSKIKKFFKELKMKMQPESEKLSGDKGICFVKLPWKFFIDAFKLEENRKLSLYKFVVQAEAKRTAWNNLMTSRRHVSRESVEAQAAMMLRVVLQDNDWENKGVTVVAASDTLGVSLWSDCGSVEIVFEIEFEGIEPTLSIPVETAPEIETGAVTEAVQLPLVSQPGNPFKSEAREQASRKSRRKMKKPKKAARSIARVTVDQAVVPKKQNEAVMIREAAVQEKEKISRSFANLDTDVAADAILDVGGLFETQESPGSEYSTGRPLLEARIFPEEESGKQREKPGKDEEVQVVSHEGYQLRVSAQDFRVLSGGPGMRKPYDKDLFLDLLVAAEKAKNDVCQEKYEVLSRNRVHLWTEVSDNPTTLFRNVSTTEQALEKELREFVIKHQEIKSIFEVWCRWNFCEEPSPEIRAELADAHEHTKPPIRWWYEYTRWCQQRPGEMKIAATERPLAKHLKQLQAWWWDWKHIYPRLVAAVADFESSHQMIIYGMQVHPDDIERGHYCLGDIQCIPTLLETLSEECTHPAFFVDSIFFIRPGS